MDCAKATDWAHRLRILRHEANVDGHLLEFRVGLTEVMGQEMAKVSWPSRLRLVNSLRLVVKHFSSGGLPSNS